MNMDPVVHISHLSIQCNTCMLDDYREHCIIIQFVIVMQDGKDHNVSNPILVSSNRVKTKEHAYKRDLLTHANVESVGMVKYVKQKLYVTQQLVMDMGNAVFTVITLTGTSER
jgi:hypothetical protein